MAFDAADFVIDPKSLTTPKARLEYLRDFLRGLPAERFDMSVWPEAEAYGSPCGTAACIGGWAEALYLGPGDHEVGTVYDVLGLSSEAGEALCYPAYAYMNSLTTPQQGARILDHLIKTGEVDWSVARQEAS